MFNRVLRQPDTNEEARWEKVTGPRPTFLM